MSKSILFTSESVSEGHPDKVCDQVSDAILDALLAQDPHSRVACETLATTGLVVVAGEITTNAVVNYAEIARKTVTEIGYDDDAKGINGKTCAVMITLDKQSADIAMGVDESGNHEQGAGDQGMMFGYACNETPELMPLPIIMSHKILQKLSEMRRDGSLPYLRPDSKSQVTVEYVDNKPVSIHTIVVSTQHGPEVTQEQIKKDVIEKVIKAVVPAQWLKPDTIYHVNPTGRFEVGGPHGDTGLTGRKIIVDTYGGMGRHGGGAFSGKDPSKVDRSAAYAARWVAKNVVAAGLADRCEVQVAYAIGVARPVSVNVNSFGTSKYDDADLTTIVEETFDLRPKAIIEQLKLKRPVYQATAAFGHFGRSGDGFTWEQTGKADELKAKAAKL